MSNLGTELENRIESSGTIVAAFTSIHNRGIGVKKTSTSLALGIVATEHGFY